MHHDLAVFSKSAEVVPTVRVGTRLHTSSKGKYAHEISDTAQCSVDEGPVQQRWRKGAVSHSLFSAVEGSFMCT